MKRRYKLLIISIIIMCFLFSPFFQFVKSITVMKIYSAYEEKYSLINKEDITIDIPGGLSTLKKDWYPFVMVFNADKSFSNYIGRDVKLTILYNFGAFEYLKGASLLYNENADYFNAFYGAYIVKDEEKPFGYSQEGNIDYEEIALVPKFDMKQLVLRGFGCSNPTFDFEIIDEYKAKKYVNINDWDVVDAVITTNSPMHKVENDYQSYIQYGKPPKNYYENEDFPIVKVYGRIYAKYFEDKKCTVFFYVIAPKEEIINECDENILKKSNLKI